MIDRGRNAKRYPPAADPCAMKVNVRAEVVRKADVRNKW